MTTIEKTTQYVMHTYGRLPIDLVGGYGSTLIDSNGKEYTDFLAGIAVNNLGYSNEAVKEAAIQQSQALFHTSNLFHIESQADLAELLCEHSFAEKAFFCNSGAEANEGAIKLARKRAYKKYGPQKNEVVAMKGSFHGRTLATLNVTDNDHYREGYGPHPTGFIFTPFNDVTVFEQAIGEQTAAVILEPVQGEGGVHPVDLAFLQKVQQLTEKYDCALIFDEVQTGIGRTGKLFAHEHYGIEPDIMTLAKALGNGVPIGAVLAKGDYAETFAPGDHGTTFGGNPFVTAVAKAVVTEVVNKNISQQAAETGAYFKEKLTQMKQEIDVVKEVRGIGLLLGMELTIPGAGIVQEMLEKGFIINCTQGNVLRFIPPLIITQAEIDQMIESLTSVIQQKVKVIV